MRLLRVWSVFWARCRGIITKRQHLLRMLAADPSNVEGARRSLRGARFAMATARLM